MKSLSYFNDNYKSPQNSSHVIKDNNDIDSRGSLIKTSDDNGRQHVEKVSIVMAKDSEK